MMMHLKIKHDTPKTIQPTFRAYLINKSDDNFASIAFQFANEYEEYDEQTGMELYDTDYPIRVLKIDNEAPECADSVLKCYSLKNRGYLLRHINIGGQIYEPEKGMELWFPLVSRPRNMCDGAVELQHQYADDGQVGVLLSLRHNCIPFMDLSGTFHYKGSIIAIENTGDESVPCRRDATVFSSGGKITAYLDHKTHKMHSVRSEVAFYEMERVVCYKQK